MWSVGEISERRTSTGFQTSMLEGGWYVVTVIVFILACVFERDVDLQYVNQDLKTLLSLPLEIKEERGRETKKREGVRETKRRGEIERERERPYADTIYSIFVYCNIG